MEKVNEKKNDSAILLMAILFLVFQSLSHIFNDHGTLTWYVQSAILAVLCFLMYYSYHTHTKNVMKPVLGAVLITFLYWKVDTAFTYLQYIDIYLEAYVGQLEVILYLFLEMALCAVLAVININHYVINSTHHSSPQMIRRNKFFYWIYFVTVFLLTVCAVLMAIGNTRDMLSNFFGCMADAFIVADVILIESKLDEFRLLREARAEEAEAAAESAPESAE